MELGICADCRTPGEVGTSCRACGRGMIERLQDRTLDSDEGTLVLSAGDLRLGERVLLPNGWDAYPHVLIKGSATGTVVDIDPEYVWITMDEDFETYEDLSWRTENWPIRGVTVPTEYIPDGVIRSIDPDGREALDLKQREVTAAAGEPAPKHCCVCGASEPDMVEDCVVTVGSDDDDSNPFPIYFCMTCDAKRD